MEPQHPKWPTKGGEIGKAEVVKPSIDSVQYDDSITRNTDVWC